MRLAAFSFAIFFLSCRSPSSSGVRDDLGVVAKPADIFSASEPLKVSLEAPINQLNTDQSFLEGANREGFLILDDGRRLPIKLTVRGQTSLQVCRFKKFEIEFSDPASLAGTPFAGQKSFDLGTHCDKDPESLDDVRLGDARAVGREQALYRMLAELTPASRRARLLEVTYIDSDSNVSTTFPAFALEELRSVRKRLGAEKAETPAPYKTLDQPAVALAFLFNLMINNADLQIGDLTFGGVKQGLALHNAKMIKIDTKLIAVPYDFDIAAAVSGFSNAPFSADFNPKFLPGATSTLKQMAFRIYFMRKHFDQATLDATISLFKEKKAALRSLVAQSHADESGKQLIASYLDAFDAATQGSVRNLPMFNLAGVPVFKDKQKKTQLCTKMPGGLPVVIRENAGSMVRVQFVSTYLNDAPGCPGIPDFDEVPVTENLWVEATAIDGTATPTP